MTALILEYLLGMTILGTVFAVMRAVWWEWLRGRGGRP